MYQEACKIALRFSQGMPKRIPDMEGLVDGRVQGAVNQLLAGKDVGLGHQPHPNGLVQHGIHQNHVIGFKGHHRIEPGFLEKLLRQDPDTMPGPLEYKGGIPEIGQADFLCCCQGMGHGKGYQQLLICNGQVRHLIGILA